MIRRNMGTWTSTTSPSPAVFWSAVDPRLISSIRKQFICPRKHAWSSLCRTSPANQRAALSSSLWTSNCCHGPENTDRFPLPPPLAACSTLRAPEGASLCRVGGSTRPGPSRGGTQAGKAADCGFTYTVRLSPGPVWQLSGTSVRLQAANYFRLNRKK